MEKSMAIAFDESRSIDFQQNNIFPNKNEFYRNADGSMLIKFSDASESLFDINNEKVLSFDEMMKNRPWTRVVFVDAES